MPSLGEAYKYTNVSVQFGVWVVLEGLPAYPLRTRRIAVDAFIVVVRLLDLQ